MFLPRSLLALISTLASAATSATVVMGCGGLVDRAGSGQGSGSGARGAGGTAGVGADGAGVALTGSTQWSRSVTDVPDGFAILGLVPVRGAGAAFIGQITPDGGRPMIERVANDGRRVWRRTIESGSVHLNSIAVDAGGAVTIGGRYVGAVDFGGPTLADFGSFVARLDDAGNNRWVWADPRRQFGVKLGSAQDGVLLSRDGYPASKLDPNGRLVWSRTWKDSPGLCSMAASADGGYALWGGLTNGARAIDIGAGLIDKEGVFMDYVALYAADGAPRWSTSFEVGYSPDGPDEGITKVAVDGHDNVWIGGQFSKALTLGGQALVTAGGTDLFVAKFDSAGKLLFARVFGSSGEEKLDDLAVDSSGRVVITGSFHESTDIGGVKLKGTADADPKGYTSTMFVAKLEPSGEVAWARSSIDQYDSESVDYVAVDPKTNEIWLAGVRRYAELAGSTWFLAKLAP